MKSIAFVAIAAVTLAGAASASTLASAPPDSWTVGNYYKQDVYGPQQNKVGSVDDVLLDKQGKVTGLVIGVGGFLGMDQKDVIVPFSDVNVQKKNNKWWLSINDTKDALKSANGFSYNSDSTTWQPAKS